MAICFRISQAVRMWLVVCGILLLVVPLFCIPSYGSLYVQCFGHNSLGLAFSPLHSVLRSGKQATIAECILFQRVWSFRSQARVDAGSAAQSRTATSTGTTAQSLQSGGLRPVVAAPVA